MHSRAYNLSNAKDRAGGTGALLLALSCLLLLVACPSVPIDQSRSKPARYAELLLGDNGRSQLIIGHDIWTGLLTVEGPGGYRHGVDCFAFFKDDGPVYVDPILYYVGHTRGTITVDRERKQVVIDVQQIISKPGDPEVTKPCPFNGTYPLESIQFATKGFLSPDLENKK